MAENEENSILFRARMEGADSVIQSVNAIGRAAEAAGDRMRSAFQHAASVNFGEQMIPRRHANVSLGEIPRGFIAGPLESRWRSARANISPIASLMHANMRHEYLRREDIARRESIRQHFFAQRIVGSHPSVALQNFLSGGASRLLLPYYPPQQEPPEPPEWIARWHDYRPRIQSAPTNAPSRGAYTFEGWRKWWNDLRNARARSGQANFFMESGSAIGMAGRARGGLGGAMLKGIGGMMRFSGALMSAAIPLIALGWVTKKLIGIIKRITGAFKGVAEENFKLFKDSAIANILAPGGSAGELNAQWRLMRMLGGDAASASALNAKIASSRAMLAYGGSGGVFMEAARLFGVNIAGSGKYGLATNKEFMAALARAMGRLDPESQIALANLVGLNTEQFWAMRGGEEAWNKRLASSQTMLDQLYGTGHFFSTSSDEAREVSEDFVRSWGEFVNAMKEFGLVLGQSVLPALRMILKVFTTIIEMVNAVLAPYMKALGWMFGGITDLFDTTKVANVMPNPAEARDEYVTSMDTLPNGRSATVNIDSIHVNTSEPITDGNSAAMGREFGARVAEQMNAA